MSLQSQNIQKQVNCLLSIRPFMEVVKYTQSLMKCLCRRLTGRNIRKLFKNIDLNWKNEWKNKTLKRTEFLFFFNWYKKTEIWNKIFLSFVWGSFTLIHVQVWNFFYKKRHTSVYLLSNRSIVFYFLFFLCLFYYFKKRIFH